MDRIRLLHFADLHIGTENYGRPHPATGMNGRVVDFLERFDELIDYTLEHEADLVVSPATPSRPAAQTPPTSAPSPGE